MTDEISTQWTGHDLLDVNGEKIGTVEDVRFGEATGGLKWLLVSTGLFGMKKVVVPAGDVKATDDALVVPFTKERVKDSPGVDTDEFFSHDAERDLCAYYGMDYAFAPRVPEEGCVGTDDDRAPGLSSVTGDQSPQHDRRS